MCQTTKHWQIIECRNDPCPHPHVCGFVKRKPHRRPLFFPIQITSCTNLLGQSHNPSNTSWQPHKPSTASQRQPMGCSSGCALFERFTTCLKWIAKYKSRYSFHNPPPSLYIQTSFQTGTNGQFSFIVYFSNVVLVCLSERVFNDYHNIMGLDSLQMQARLRRENVFLIIVRNT
jgi:hypothetical protein